MTQQQFLRALSRKLRGVPAPEREEALRYYKEYLQEAALDPQADVTPLVGTPEECARGILADSLIRKEQSANVKSGWESFWLVVLGIFAAPVALPLAIAALVQDGHLYRVKSKGTFVSQPKVLYHMFGHAYSDDIRESGRVPQEDQQTLLPAGGRSV